MAWVAMVLCLVVAALGAVGVVSPGALLRIAHYFQTSLGLYAAAALRIVLGGALWFAAPGSRAPRLIRAIGLLVLVAGLVTPLFGVERFHGILDWWSARGPAFMRAWAAVVLAFGCTLAYGLMPGRRAANSAGDPTASPRDEDARLPR
jgi:hypothetical protein